MTGRVLVLVFALSTAGLALADEPHDAGAGPSHDASEPSAPAVTESNLLESEKFWPYRVAITKRDLSSRLEPGNEGVLIRVEDGDRARIDFGRDGVHTVPVAITNLVAESNRVRLGEVPKLSPNLVLAIGPRLNGSAKGGGRLPLLESASQRGFIVAFADPKDEKFPVLAKSLAPLASHSGVMTVLLPQSLVNENTFGARLADLGWPIPYVYDYLAPGYTESLLANGMKPPAVSLLTAEGRQLFAREWSAGSVAELGAELRRHFPADQPPVTAPPRPSR